jgi:hypothetical protein
MQQTYCAAGFDPAHVRVGSITSHRHASNARGMSAMPPRATKSVHRSDPPLRANRRHMHRSKDSRYSITSSAVASSLSGTARPSIRAVEALMTNSNLVGCTTGKSAGLAPLRMRPA